MLPKRFIFGLSLHLLLGCTGGTDMRCVVIGKACPPTWIQWGDKCYKVTEPLTWFEAKGECIKMESGFAAPNSDQETDFLLTLAQEFWINCNDLQVEGTWVCQDGSTDVKYRNWTQGEPNDSNSAEDCAAVRSHGRWNDWPCQWRRPAVCQLPASQLHG